MDDKIAEEQQRDYFLSCCRSLAYDVDRRFMKFIHVVVLSALASSTVELKPAFSISNQPFGGTSKGRLSMRSNNTKTLTRPILRKA
jgi:hypothetical protein